MSYGSADGTLHWVESAEMVPRAGEESAADHKSPKRARHALRLNWIAASLVPVLMHCSLAHAQSMSHRGVRAVKNPFARAMLFPIEYDVARPIGRYGRAQHGFLFQPLIPFPLNSKWDLITQTSVPAVAQPDVSSPGEGQFGLGDINLNFYFSPDNQGRVHWGVGPALLIPSATSEPVGTGKWSGGFAGALIVEPGEWTLGISGTHLRSFAGDPDRPDVRYSTLQYQVTHNFWRGWYLTASPTSVADWTAPPEDRWLMPVGLGIGNVFSIGHRHFGGEFSAYYSLIHPRTMPYAKWIFSLQITFARTSRR